MPSAESMLMLGRHEHFCATCLKGERVFRQKNLHICSRCDIVRYCSKECQKKDWPEHKLACDGTDKRSGIPGLIRALVDNTAVKLTLQACAILEFDLVRQSAIDVPLFARVDVQMEPSDIGDLENILLGKGPIPDKIQGMLQITGFLAAEPVPLQELELDKSRNTWLAGRDVAAAQGHPNEHVVVFDICYACGPAAINVPMVIHPKLKDPAPTGTVAENLEDLNMRIRLNEENKMSDLRSEMQPSDIRIMREAAAFTKRGPPFQMIAKFSIEEVYADIYERLLKHWNAHKGKATPR